MNITIVEDEIPAYRRLTKLLQQFLPDAQIAEQIESIAQAVNYFPAQPTPDLVFMDIQLADGLSFSIFEQVNIEAPIIFTTAFDQYTLRAFKLHSVDYLLKPIDPDELQQSIEKFRRLYLHGPPKQQDALQSILRDLLPTANYRKRFLVKIGTSLTYLPVDDIAYFYSDQSMVFARKFDGKQHHLDVTLDQLEQQLSPKDYFRISRKVIICPSSIQKIDSYFNGRLIVELQPKATFATTVSRDRVSAFKAWLDQ